MEKINQINSLLKGLDKKNKTDALYLNIVNSEFITFTKRIQVPQIPVSEIEFDHSLQILEQLVDVVPEFITDHEILHKKNPPGDQHWIHLIKRYEGREINFVHLFKIDLKFG